MKRIDLYAVLALLYGAAAPAHSATLGLEVSQLIAQATSVVLPSSPGFPCGGGGGVPCPATGDFSIIHQQGPIGTIDQATGTGSIYFSASVTSPLFAALGIGPVNLTQAGTFFLSASDSALIAVDIGYAELPVFGRVYISNTNQNVKNIDTLRFGLPGNSTNGVFESLTPEQYERLLDGVLRNMLDDAMELLQGIDPLVPPLAPSVLDTIAGIYDDNPSTELVLFFADAAPGDQFRLSQLTGTDMLTLAAIPEPATLALVALGFLAMMRRRPLGKPAGKIDT